MQTTKISLASLMQRDSSMIDIYRSSSKECFGIFVLLKNFSFKRIPHHSRWRAANVAIGQWGIFSVLHLLWDEASVYNGHLRGPVTLTPIAEQWSCHYPFLRLRSVADGIRTHNLNNLIFHCIDEFADTNCEKNEGNVDLTDTCLYIDLLNKRNHWIDTFEHLLVLYILIDQWESILIQCFFQ